MTPVRDEAENLDRLAACVLKQRRLPQRWIIVDNGSQDTTREYASRLAEENLWIELIESAAATNAAPGAPIVRAFHAGLARLSDSMPDIVVKLDADVSFDEHYFDDLARAFEADPLLGIASGECLEMRSGLWQPMHVTEGHARGATRAYRRECLHELLPLPERMGWDSIDELKANVRGWRTGIVGDASFHHHRRVGERDGEPWRRWVRQGRACHHIGYRPSYLLLRTLRRCLQDPAAMGMLAGYLVASLRRDTKLDDPLVHAHLRDRQRLRALHLRARETSGRAVGP